MSNRKIGAVARELIAAKKRIEDPENWCQGSYGLVEGPMCVKGALYRGGEAWLLWPFIDDVASQHFQLDAREVNDQLGHSAAMRLFDHAIAKAISEGK